MTEQTERRQPAAGAERDHPLHDVVGVPGRHAAAGGLREDLAGEVEALFEQLAGKDVTVRGTYDVSGLRADADLMIWWHSGSSDALQEAYRLFRRTALGRHLTPVWSQMALHRPAEFNKSHMPAFLAGEEPARLHLRLPVRPLLRVVPAAGRGAARRCWPSTARWPRGYPDVRANTVASFALGDYEWMLAFEADELHRIVDLMRDLRASAARRHVREEVPFYTGPASPVAELVADLL